MLTEQEVTKFQEIYKAHFGKPISREDAYAQGIKLLQLMKIIYKPMTKADFEKLNLRRNKS